MKTEHWVLIVACAVVAILLVIELWDLLNERYATDRPMGECSSSKSDASGASRPRARAMGGYAGSQAQNAASEPSRNRPKVGENDWREAGSVKNEVKSLHENGEGVSK